MTSPLPGPRILSLERALWGQGRPFPRVWSASGPVAAVKSDSKVGLAGWAPGRAVGFFFFYPHRVSPNSISPAGNSGRGTESGTRAGRGPESEPAECFSHLRPPEHHAGPERPVCHAVGGRVSHSAYITSREFSHSQRESHEVTIGPSPLALFSQPSLPLTSPVTYLQLSHPSLIHGSLSAQRGVIRDLPLRRLGRS